MIRIILLLDSYTLQAWQWELVKSLTECGHGKIVACVINQNPKTSGDKSPLLYRGYRWLDRKLFLNQLDAFAKKNLTEIPEWNVPNLEISPIQKKYSDYFKAEDLTRINAYQPDVIIRLGFRILRGEILTLPRLGVWSFHHGDPGYYRGGPPAFWEVMNGKSVTGTVLQRLTENLDEGQVLYSSFSQTDPLSVDRNAQRIFWKSAFFPARVIQQIQLEGEEKWMTSLEKNKANPAGPLLRPPATFSMMRMVVNLLIRNLKRKVDETFNPPHWEIARMDSPIRMEDASLKTIKPTFLRPSNGSESYFADPFPVHSDGSTFVFYEEFDKKKGKGKISCGKLEGTTLGAAQVVLEEAWHLSYPFLFQFQSSHFLIPESAEAGKINCYRAKNFPFEWESGQEFFPEAGYDPTVYEKDGKFWLFINQRIHPGISPFDELYLYWCVDILNPTWNSHPKNPIVSDVRCARPAGRIFEEKEKLIRPAQDSGLRYGHQVVLKEIKVLDERDYQEETLLTISPDSVPNALGVHTFNRLGAAIFLDFYYRK